MRAAFDTFKDPLIYTPGDNEWTDCHRAGNGGCGAGGGGAGLDRRHVRRRRGGRPGGRGAGHAGRHLGPGADPGQAAVVERIAARTAAFEGQVLVVQGDSHVFAADKPLGLPNFTRIVVHGATLPFEYLRLTVDPRRGPLSRWERAPVAGPASP